MLLFFTVVSAKRTIQKKISAAALMRAIQSQNASDEATDNLPVAPEKKDASSQTESNESAEGNDSLAIKINKCLLLLSHVNTKVDALGANQYQQPGRSSNEQINLSKITFQPVKSLADFESLEDRCRDESFVKGIVASIGNIHGRHRYTSQGATVSLRIINYFFTRDFLLQCSWTGATRSSGNKEAKKQKVPFMKFDRTIDLFYQTVLYSDPSYTLDECKTFLHRCLKNAHQRFAEVTGIRKPVSRKRKQLTNEVVPPEDRMTGGQSKDFDNIAEADTSYNEGSLVETNGNASWQVEFLEEEENLPPKWLKIEN